ncbi:septum site-determining protein MinC [Leptolyngbya sp. CCNP1308]|uniref:septum site-determining protein MinC n=1 Tax=Leptolyngbya sp. CCNP1308 TaxID=3110255 RepID=UPI002B1EE5AB|nr:septum site-determining protein MinC [Leptolyngbya sp. CCNP1308]MEA5451336.1 septum site-determining protein MinC [Leptolyngbya sp. CCNP1308]
MVPDDSASLAITEAATDPEMPSVNASTPAPSDMPEPAAQTNSGVSDDPEVAADAPPVPAPPIDPRTQLRLRNDGDRLVLLMPNGPQGEAEGGALAWGELLQHFKQRLNGGEPFWQPNTVVHLAARDRLLDARQLQALEEILTAAHLTLKRVATSRRQTAIAAVAAGYSVDQLEAEDTLVKSPPTPGKPLAEPLYLQTTLRGGVEIRHPGTIVVMGDVNPGSSLVAEGDILVWGRLRGTAHAGSGGDRSRCIMALQMHPTQLRLADLVARAPDGPTGNYLPEVAYVGDNGIRIAQAQAFARQHFDATLGQGAQLTDAFKG